ncbi:WG repeat-containing protein, partial [Emticicia sp. W12TSBA100-4]|uniref:WG repeat-containing protein n=1 Tax=Emticicia sp. W12TSBA100-4 TaxID=3160965 RepID=UPI003305E987
MLIPYTNGKKWGYCTSDKNVVIPFIFDYVDTFKNGMAKVKKGKKIGYINEDNFEIIPIIYDSINWHMQEKYAIVELNGKYGTLVNNSDNTFTGLVPCEYDSICFYFQDKYMILETNGKNEIFFKYNDEAFVKPLPYEYDYIDMGSLCEELRISVVRRGKVGFICASTGLEIIPCIYDFTKSMRQDCEVILPSFSEGLALVRKGGKYGFIDTLGRIKIPFIFEKATPFNRYGTSRVYKIDKWIHIYNQGNEIIPINKYGVKRIPYLLDNNRNYREKLTIQDGKKWILLNDFGYPITPSPYLGHDLDFYCKQHDGKWGVIYTIETNVFWALPPTYETIKQLTENFILVCLNKKLGLINFKFEEVLPCMNDKIEQFSKSLLKVKRMGLYGLLNHNLEEVLPCKYDEIKENFNEKGDYGELHSFTCQKEQCIGFIDNDGRVIIPGHNHDGLKPNERFNLCTSFLLRADPEKYKDIRIYQGTVIYFHDNLSRIKKT